MITKCLEILKSFFPKPKVKVRLVPNSKICPICGTPDNVMIYDQEHDCCFTCNSKWEIKEEIE